VQIFVNGQDRVVADGSSIADLLALLELESRHVAVEVNLELVPRGRHAEHLLSSGDQLEVVTLVGGG
jgi:sulfur carrier protein